MTELSSELTITLKAFLRIRASYLPSYATAYQYYQAFTETENLAFKNAPDLTQVVNEQEARILKSRLRGNTLQAVGSTEGLTRERVRQIENKAKRKLAYFAMDRSADGTFA